MDTTSVEFDRYQTPKRETISRDLVIVDEDIQIRTGGVDPDAVERYAEGYRNDATLMPLPSVFRTEQGLLLVDGFHRIRAKDAVEGGKAYRMNMWVYEGDRRAAEIFAATANARQGQAMSREDRQQAMRRLLRHTDWSYREIARQLCVAASTVLRLDERELIRPGVAFATPGTVTGADGKQYPARNKSMSPAEAMPDAEPAPVPDDGDGEDAAESPTVHPVDSDAPSGQRFSAGGGGGVGVRLRRDHTATAHDMAAAMARAGGMPSNPDELPEWAQGVGVDSGWTSHADGTQTKPPDMSEEDLAKRNSRICDGVRIGITQIRKALGDYEKQTGDFDSRRRLEPLLDDMSARLAARMRALS